MPEDDRPPTCPDHRWTKPLPRLIENRDGQLVEHPTERMRFCTGCPAEETVLREPK